MENLAAKYRPKTLDDVVEQSVVVDIVRNICKSTEITNRNFLFIGPAGTGKALKMDAPILAEHGFIQMKDVEVGTKVWTHNGNLGSVSGVYPQGARPIYRITLADGAHIEVSDNHLNVVQKDGESALQIMTTLDLIKDEVYRHFSIPVANLNDVLSALDIDDPYRYSQDRHISDICYVGNYECQCIMVDHPDHTFISNDFVMTHNTTTARIIANMLNEGKGEPIEIDAASHSGVDAMRELVSQMQSYPIGCKYKVFIIDEIHSLSQAAFQAMLKPLESQCAMSVVICCTTNPEKIPGTILSRVQTFQLSKISLDGIYNRLKYIIEQENKEGRGITYEDDAILYIAKLAQGGMRDAITLCDKALASTNNITVPSLIKSLGLPNYDEYFELLNAIAKKDNAKIVSIINSVYNSGVNFVKWFDGFFAFITNIVKFIYLQDINQTMIPSIYQDKIAGYGTAHSALCLKLSNKLVKMNQELKTTQYLQELAISYLCTPPATKKG